MKRKLDRVSRRMGEHVYGNFDCKTNIVALHTQRMIFFAVPKVANSSFKSLMTQLLWDQLPKDIRAVVDAGGNPFHGKTVRRRMYEEKFLLCKHQLARYRGYDSFAFVRNPWSRLVSCYSNKIASKDFSDGPRSKGTTGALDRAGLFKEEMTFRDFALAVAQIPDQDADRHFRSQYSFLKGRGACLLPTEIGKLESLDVDLKRILGDRIPHIELPHLKQTSHKDYREYYDDETRDAISKRYATDIEWFGYSFG